ncbi:LuxR C-terminal-related transcriptional regulator [Actinoplanes teichomyceticus]|uniref:LuxR C-terminal-related transcriptional regulator n=1 Tax=Actinoplanes teichomyceticus TaxID=1867 RepID=UPI003D15FC52
MAGPTGLLIATATIGALTLRRRHPVATLAHSAAMFALQLALTPLPLPANIAQALAIYTAASLTIRLHTLAGSLAAGLRRSTEPQYTRNALVITALLAVPATLTWMIGNLVRGRETNLHALHQATARLHDTHRQRARFLAPQQRVAAAREIHDIVAHSLTVVIVQADAAHYAAEHPGPGDHTDTRTALATIAHTARTALTEVRDVIDVLRDPDTTDDPPEPTVNPADLTRLAAAVRAAGLPVELHTDPAAVAQTPAAVRFAVLRIVREALTNVLEHAGAHATARVSIHRTPHAVHVHIQDDGTGHRTAATTTAAGHGLHGMRERLRALDGTLTAGPRVMLTTFDSDDLLVAALRAGASGYLVKDAGPAELLTAIRAAAVGEAPVSPRLVRRLIDSFVLTAPAPPATDPPATLARLTTREREILSAIGLGLTNAEIAARLHVAESTVKTHVGSVLRKLHLRDRVQAVILAQTHATTDDPHAPGRPRARPHPQRCPPARTTPSRR